MTPEEIKDHRLSLGLTKGRAAFYFGVDARTWRRWESGQKPVSLSAAILLRISVKSPLVWEVVRSVAEHAPQSPPPRDVR